MKKARSLLAIMTIALFALSLIGCEPLEDAEEENGGSKSYSSDAAGAMNCVIVYSQHMNSKTPKGGLDAYVRGAKEAEGFLAFVRLDGDPSVVYSEQAKNENENERRLEEENNEYVNDRMAELERIVATEEEVDILDAITLANKCLGQAKNPNLENVVVIVGTGLSTKGTIDFSTTGLKLLDLDDYKSWIEKSGQLPKLDHVDKIIWYGFGDVDGQQEEFQTPEYEEELKVFYEALLASAGVKNGIEWIDILEANDAPSDLPSVSVVTMKPKPKYNKDSDDVTLEAQVLFNPDEATFLNGLDPKKDENINDIAYAIKENNLKVTVTGYTAHYNTPKDNEALSLARAEAIKAVLVELGCPEESIKAVGGGWGPYGEGSEEIDQKNRCVVFDFDS